MRAKTVAKSRILGAVHEGARDLHRLGCLDEARMQNYDLLCQETQAMLKILALGHQDVEAGRVKPVAEVVTRLRAKRTVA